MSSAAGSQPVVADDPPQLIGDRYEVERVLGRGGMSVVYAVRDRHTARRCALKQLAPRSESHRAQFAAQFQREYAILGQLSHPSIITVYDYGIAGDSAFYTMELLEGSDLNELAPLPVPRTCKLLREVASALALLHSRRLLHRDATANNVRLDADGSAKLIDFGAMVHMGTPEHVIGTPPYLPPEALHGLPLDGRVDLFALGALAYFLLTKRHAYPASSVAELRELWQQRPRAPSELAPDIPRGLDDLVLALLDTDVSVRPSNAAEVIERLTAVAGLPSDRRLAVAQSYLTTPALVGRESHIARARQYLDRAAHGHGSALLIEADAGLGRSRLLSSYGLEARLGGALGVRVSAKGQSHNEFGVARAVVRQLLELAPEATLASARSRAALLGHVAPELHAALGAPELASSADRARFQPQLSAALTAWLCELAHSRYLAIAVDDVDEADQRSLSWLVELARAAQSRRLFIATTARSGATARLGRSFDMLSVASVHVALAPLSATEVEALLRSLFGDVRNLNLVAGWVNDLAQGNPEAVMSLAQHLVDRGLARYQGSAWILPGNEVRQIMPHNLRDAWSARIDGLQGHARALAETLALIVGTDALDLASDRDLLRDIPQGSLDAALDELVARRILRAVDGRYSFAQSELPAVVRSRVAAERQQALERTLADAYLARNQLLIAAHHLQQAADDAGACDVALRWCTLRSQGQHDDLAIWRTRTGVQVLENALRHAEARGCSPREAYLLRRQLLQISVVVDIPFADIARQILERLRIDTGIALWREDTDIDPQCLTLANEHYEAASEAERGLSPFEALRELATVTIMLSGAYGRQIDVVAMSTLLPLLAPFRGLGPLLQLLYDITSGAVDRVRGRRFSDHVVSLLQRLEQPMPGLDEFTRHGARSLLTYYLALEQAQLGSPAVLAHADFIATDPAFEALAWHLRMVKHLYSGEALRAEACRERAELLSLRHPDTLNQLMASILYETEAHALSANLIALKTALPQLEQLARHSSGWRAFSQTIRGEYEMLCGRHERACEDFERVLDFARPGAHTAWSRTASSYVANLNAMGEYARAIAFGEQACRDSAQHRVNPLYGVLLRAGVARAYAELGDHERARVEVEHVLTEAAELEMTGVPLGCIYEAAARVALCAGDTGRFEHALEQTRTHYTQGGSEAVAAKYHRLMSNAFRRWSMPAAAPTPEPNQVADQFSKQWTTGQNAHERAQLALSAVLADCAANGGGLYGTCAGSLLLMAASGTFEREEATRLAQQQLTQALSAGDETVCESMGELTKPILLTATSGDRTLVVGVIVLTNPPADRPLPWSLLQAVGRALLESADVQPIPLAYDQ
ncbi:MAG TPA: protein kinase [Polyangiales bacterium]|nr:protein kinase [Polyangiales bacterium]